MASIIMFKPSLRALVVLISLVFRPTQPFLYTAIPHRFAHGNALQNSPLETTSSSLPSSDWENLGGNYILRPPSDVAVRAVIHFLGGAFVGAAPHVTYRYLLHGFAQQGYLVVTTPYRLGFDYLEVCDSVLECFERAAVPLAKQYGALPVVGMGHSCGALLQVYITCLFPDTPRAANALISFNNKPVSTVALHHFFPTCCAMGLNIAFLASIVSPALLFR